MQNLTNVQVVTFKTAIIAALAANSVEIDDITVKGNLTSCPLLPYVRAGQMFLRLKQQ